MHWTYNYAGYWAEAGWAAIGAYLLGCFTTGYYLVRLRTGKDLRACGSGSLGARNAGRELGKTGFALTVAGDLGKGLLAVWLARRFGSNPGVEAIALVSVLAGHLWPFQLRLQGGKGVATCLGALLVFDFRLAVTWGLMFAAPYVMLRKSTLPAMLAFAMLPFATMWFDRQHSLPELVVRSIGVTLASAFVLLAHRKNISHEISAFLERRSVRTKELRQ